MVVEDLGEGFGVAMAWVGVGLVCFSSSMVVSVGMAWVEDRMGEPAGACLVSFSSSMVVSSEKKALVARRDSQKVEIADWCIGCEDRWILIFGKI